MFSFIEWMCSFFQPRPRDDDTDKEHEVGLYIVECTFLKTVIKTLEDYHLNSYLIIMFSRKKPKKKKKPCKGSDVSVHH